ncbi:Argininosuccinate lyase [Variovorax sp. PBL-H6]|uniref:tripartite tricarboxylate transporter substrate binding protein n=1 Tax=Variovorax sp. PBL-H6 TaxID=434009 RepID=UPI001317768D|nr:tripartite tricarboxylate transporter substrate binding protein [Variovorax sp. PBL-H6]VTU33562.1 Argininosuccinate lyase [Variovorax sp. PBL-H6]
MKKLLLVLALAAMASAAAAQIPAAEWPKKVVKIVVGYAPGGPNDIIARALGQKVSAALGQPVIVENRPGASGTIASDYVARSPADGYTLIMNATTHSMANALYEKLPFDADRDFTPITLVGESTLVLVVRQDQPEKTLAELLNTARSQPGKLSFASTGAGSSPHLAGEMLRQLGKVDLTHVPYKGSAPAMNDLLGGQVTMMFEPLPSALPHIRAGQLRPVGVTSGKRIRELPDVPTMTEAGVPGFDITVWWGLFGPARMPPAVVQKIGMTVNTALSAPDIRERFDTLGITPVGTTSTEFRSVLLKDIAKYGKVIREGGIHAN